MTRSRDALAERMEWQHIPWYTITDDWDKDFGVDQWHGHTAFIRDGRTVFRTYFPRLVHNIDCRRGSHLYTSIAFLVGTMNAASMSGFVAVTLLYVGLLCLTGAERA